ncbi:MAG: polysaccharide deacetylase [Alphaproteobacteria bacterium]|nr:polysaccharide deacetylase [Alphaproteobacteria bacterium]
MPRHIACLSFDFDTWSGFAARGLTTPTPISRGEFGVLGAARILELLRRHAIPSTWYVPGIVIETYPERCGEIVAGGHEVSHHGWTHVPPANLTAAEEDDGLRRGIAAIERLTGRRPPGYRSPAWDISDRTVDLLLREGFLYESSLMGNDHCPYFVRRGDAVTADAPARFGQHTKLIEMPISWSLDDFPHFEFLRTQTQLLPGLANARLVLENWIADFDYMVQSCDWGILTYTFHPYVIGRGHRMLALAGLIEALQQRGAVFMTIEQAALEFRGKAERGEVVPYP